MSLSLSLSVLPGVLHEGVQLGGLDGLDGGRVAGIVHRVPRLLRRQRIQLERSLERAEIDLFHYLNKTQFGVKFRHKKKFLTTKNPGKTNNENCKSGSYP